MIFELSVFANQLAIETLTLFEMTLPLKVILIVILLYAIQMIAKQFSRNNQENNSVAKYINNERQSLSALSGAAESTRVISRSSLVSVS